MTEEKIVVSKKIRALFALKKLSKKLQNDVLKDPTAVALWDISTKRTVQLADGLTVQWKSLFSIFQAVADCTPAPPLVDERNTEHPVKASIDPNGTGLLELGSHRFRFSHVALMSASSEARLLELERLFDALTINEKLQEELRGIVRRNDYWIDEFMAAIEALSSSPEEFQAGLSEKASRGPVAFSDILPTDHRHWDNLTAPIVVSDTLADFIATELASERAARMARNPVLAYRSIALTFSAPALVPLDLFRDLDKETKRRILEEALLLDDHFSLVGAFELCANWITKDPEFSDAGDRLLDRLFGDLKRLEIACGMFGAAFVLSVAKIAEDDKLNSKPAFWRRLAASSHALLVVRACGVTEIDHDELIEGSLRQSGQAYNLSVLCDFKTDPRWRPEWIDPRLLLSDACGRAIVACANISKEKTPASWTERIDKLRAWISEKHYQLLTSYPAVLEGARRQVMPVVSEMHEIGELYEEFMREPTVDYLLRMKPAIHTFGPPREVVESLHKVVGIVRADSSADREGNLADAIRLLSHIAALLQETNLANTVAEASIERLAIDEQRETVIETIYRLLECSAAEKDSSAARLLLSRKLEQVCYTITKPELLAEIVTWIEELKLISPELKCSLGRALSIAKLGASGPATV